MVRSTKSKKIPRPLNAFILYRRDHARKCPGMVAKELSTSLGRSWRTETPERRAFYEEKARQAKILHRQMYPDYTFSPIKRGEGKRAKKLKAMAAQVAVDGASPTVAVKKRMRMASMSLKSSVEVDQAVQRARLALIAEGSTTGRSGATRKSRRLAATRTRYSPPTAQIKKEEPEEETVERYSRHRGQHYPGKNQQVPRCSQMAVLAAEAFDMMALMRRRARSASCSSSSTLSSYASDTDTDDDEDDDDDDDWAPGDQSRTCTSVLSLSFESNYEMAHRSVAGSVCQDSVAQHLLQAKMEPLDARMYTNSEMPSPSPSSPYTSSSEPPQLESPTSAITILPHPSSPPPSSPSAVPPSIDPPSAASANLEVEGNKSMIAHTHNQMSMPLVMWIEDSLCYSDRHPMWPAYKCTDLHCVGLCMEHDQDDLRGSQYLIGTSFIPNMALIPYIPPISSFLKIIPPSSISRMLDPSVMLTRPQVMTLELFKRHALNDEGFLSL